MSDGKITIYQTTYYRYSDAKIGDFLRQKRYSWVLTDGELAIEFYFYGMNNDETMSDALFSDIGYVGLARIDVHSSSPLYENDTPIDECNVLCSQCYSESCEMSGFNLLKTLPRRYDDPDTTNIIIAKLQSWYDSLKVNNKD